MSGPSVQADSVVMTLPCTVLRTINLSPMLGLSADKGRPDATSPKNRRSAAYLSAVHDAAPMSLEILRHSQNR